MTKRHFIALADHLRSMTHECPALTASQLERMADFCQSQNPRFNRGRWIGYIKGENGPNGGKIK